jgi:hypothetical protein
MLTETRTPELVALFAAGNRPRAGLSHLDIYDLDTALDAVNDAIDVATTDRAARLGRVRSALEHELAGRLDR